jgi:hypothetical protein
METFSQSMTFGRIAYRFFFKPTFTLRYHITHFGLLGWIEMCRCEGQMKRAARKLRTIRLSQDKLLQASFLTGEKYWHQTLFCAYTLARSLDGQVGIKLYSDGTLTDEHIECIGKVLPGVESTSELEVIKILDAVLPEQNFPTLRHLRKWHPFFRRLIDIHTSPSWTLHLDSDMLFLSKPRQVLAAYQSKTSVYMKERLADSYFVDTIENLRDNHGINCLKKVNGGMVAYDSDRIDYNDLEKKAKYLLQKFPDAGPAQVEQTLMSYILYLQTAVALNEDEYAIFYDKRPQFSDLQTVRHYIFKAKFPYFTKEWKKVIR